MSRISLPRSGDVENPGEVVRTSARICGSCGYHHQQQVGTDVCDNCRQTLDHVWNNLMQLQSVVTRRRQRISSDEEERNRIGYELQTTYRFIPRAGHPGSSRALVRSSAGTELAELTYADSAELRVTNLGRRTRKHQDVHGFVLDLQKGWWLKDSDEPAGEDPQGQEFDQAGVRNTARVTPYVEDRRNIALLRWPSEVSESEAVSLRYAIERGIEAAFQLEDSELTSQDLPDAEKRGRLLLIEAAEGGAGVLRRLWSEAGALGIVARTALEIIHVDPETGQADDDACVRGCYRCLLSYGNQRDHEAIDRRIIVGRLRQLAGSLTAATDGDAFPVSVGTSSGVPLGVRGKQLLQHLLAHNLNRPEHTGQEIESCVVDLVFGRDIPSAVLVAEIGRPIPDPARLFDIGWNVVEVGLEVEFDDIVRANPTVFGVRR